MGVNPNFPDNLDIHPSLNLGGIKSDSDRNFDEVAQEEAIREYGIAGRVWEAAYAMGTYINSLSLEFDPPFFPTATTSPSSDRMTGCPSLILELGSGTGVVVAWVSKFLKGKGDIVIATDLPEVCPLLVKNLKDLILKEDIDIYPTVLARPLSWGDQKHISDIFSELSSLVPSFTSPTLTHIICSDLVYFPELLAPLLRSLIHLTSPPCGHPPPGWWPSIPAVVISYKIRSLAKETAFWSAFGLWFDFEPVLERRKAEKVGFSLSESHLSDMEPQDTDGDNAWRRFGRSFGGDMFIFAARRRPESLTWEVPESDAELLDGVGAMGNRAQKGDGTFESLLLMSVDLEG